MANKVNHPGAPSHAAEPQHPRTRSLAVQAADQVMHLSMTLNAYLAVEKLITPEYAVDADEGIGLSRAELSSLLRIVNAELQQMVNQLSDTTTVLEALTKGPATSP